MSKIRKSDLSPRQRELVQLMQDLYFGRILRLRIHGGEPSPDSALVLEKEVKFGAADPPLVEPEHDCFLKDQVVELLRYIREMDGGIIELLEVRHGLPFRMRVNCASIFTENF